MPNSASCFARERLLRPRSGVPASPEVGTRGAGRRAGRGGATGFAPDGALGTTLGPVGPAAPLAGSATAGSQANRLAYQALPGGRGFHPAATSVAARSSAASVTACSAAGPSGGQSSAGDRAISTVPAPRAMTQKRDSPSIWRHSISAAQVRPGSGGEPAGAVVGGGSPAARPAGPSRRGRASALRGSLSSGPCVAATVVIVIARAVVSVPARLKRPDGRCQRAGTGCPAATELAGSGTGAAAGSVSRRRRPLTRANVSIPPAMTSASSTRTNTGTPLSLPAAAPAGRGLVRALAAGEDAGFGAGSAVGASG
jgi:hypothetical protein